MPPYTEGAHFGVPHESLEAYVAFSAACKVMPWTAVTGREWSHCWVFWAKYYPAPSLTAERWTIKLESTPAGLHIDTWVHDPDDVAAQFAKLVTEIVKVRRVVRHDRLRFRGLITCVSVVKAALGLNAPLVITPKQLRDHLVYRCAGRPMEVEE